MEKHYYIVGYNRSTNKTIADVLLGETTSDDKQNRVTYDNGNKHVTILYGLEEEKNKRFLGSVDITEGSSILLLCTQESVGKYDDFLKGKTLPQDKIFLIDMIMEVPFDDRDENTTRRETEPSSTTVSQGSGTGLSKAKRGVKRPTGDTTDPKRLKTKTDASTLAQTYQLTCFDIKEKINVSCLLEMINGAMQMPRAGTGMDSSLTRVVIIIGGHDSGKSSLGNLLLQKKEFEVFMYQEKRVTEIRKASGKGLIVYEIPSDINHLQDELKAIIKKEESTDIVFIYTVKFGSEITGKEEKQLNELKKILDEELLHLTVAITHGDEYQCMFQYELSYQEDLQLDFRSRRKSITFSNRVINLLKYCRGRFYLVNNKARAEAREQIRKEILLML